ncbi:MAG TPA: O-antigen ligase family protein [Salinarimonas sp.]|nr:O-antigen ligase family protein [Salinarimonas sp.]
MTQAFHPAQAGLAALPVRTLAERVGLGLLALMIVFGCFTFMQPSPYDFIAIPTILVWLALGVRLHRGAVVFLAPLILYHVALGIALVPYLSEPLSFAWSYQSLYLMVTAVFFVMLFSDDTARRVEVALQAYVASCVVASLAGVLSYVGLAPGFLFTMDGRAAGVFEDPNVLGSYLILGALYLMHNLLTGAARRPVASFLVLLLILGTIFLSFSRGSWGATVVATTVMVAVTFVTARARWLRRRIVALGVAAALVGAVGLGALLSIGSVAERFADRATLSKDYDQGETGRFGNQLRSIPMLMERPNGFGPLRFRVHFGLEPHNSYIGGFANAGWLGGFAWIGLTLVTCFVGFRLMLTPSPVMRTAQIAFPTLLVFFLQAFQIDIDHWRHVFLLMGLVWGLECARQAWLRRLPYSAAIATGAGARPSASA